MKHISEESLNDLPSRIQYLRDFIEFTDNDAAALHAAAPVVGPLVPAVVDAVYQKLLSFDITANSFVPRQTGFNGDVPKEASELSLEHPQIKFRKDFLSGYLVKLVTMDYSKLESFEYLNKVGLLHTGQAGFAHRCVITVTSFTKTDELGLYRKTKPALRVEYIHCGILLGYVQDILINAVITHPTLDIPTKNAVMRAANKVSNLFVFTCVSNNCTNLNSLSRIRLFGFRMTFSRGTTLLRARLSKLRLTRTSIYIRCSDLDDRQQHRGIDLGKTCKYIVITKYVHKICPIRSEARITHQT